MLSRRIFHIEQASHARWGVAIITHVILVIILEVRRHVLQKLTQINILTTSGLGKSRRESLLTLPIKYADKITMIILLPIFISSCRLFCVESIPPSVATEYCSIVARCDLIKSRDMSKPRTRIAPRRLSNEYYRCREQVNATHTKLMREQDYCDGVKLSCR